MSNRTSRSSQRHRCRPEVEVLEDRTMPASLLSSIESALENVAAATVAVRAAEDTLASVLTTQFAGRQSDSGDGQSSERGDHGNGRHHGDDEGGQGRRASRHARNTATAHVAVSSNAATVSRAAAAPATTGTGPAANIQSRGSVAAEEGAASSDHPVNTPSAEAKAEEAADVAEELHAAPADEALAFAASRREEQHPARAPAPAPTPQEADIPVARPNDVLGPVPEARVPPRAVTEALDTVDPADLVWVTDADALSPADGSPGVDAALSLQVGGHRMLPQRGSTVAPVATMLGDGAPEASAPAAADARLNDLFLNPLSVAPAAPTEPPPAREAPAKDAAYLEAETFLGPHLRPLLLVPLVGWCIVEGRRLWKRRKNLPRRRAL